MTRFQDAAYKLAEEAAVIKDRYKLSNMEMRDVIDIVKTEYADLVVAEAMENEARAREAEDGSQSHRFEDGRGRSVLK